MASLPLQNKILSNVKIVRKEATVPKQPFKYGNHYQMSAPDGIQNKYYIFSLKMGHLTSTERDTIISFLLAQGLHTKFNITLPTGTYNVRFVPNSFKEMPINKEKFTISFDVQEYKL